MNVVNENGMNFLRNVDNNSIDLILTDPPYIISHRTGMNEHHKNVEEAGGKNMKTNEEWEEYKIKNAIKDDKHKDSYIRYGTVYGKMYAVKTDYGDWDKDFTMDDLDAYISEYYKKLRKGGTIIVFFDIWKLSELKTLLEKHKFKQIRFIEWIKTNPQPLNSNANYLTNCREIALTGVKGGKSTFNSSYDNGIYMFPLQGGKNRFHPTQKSLKLFEAIIEKHSNEGDTVMDTFLGSGTTALASKNTGRKFTGCELNPDYFKKIKNLLGIV